MDLYVFKNAYRARDEFEQECARRAADPDVTFTANRISMEIRATERTAAARYGYAEDLRDVDKFMGLDVTSVYVDPACAPAVHEWFRQVFPKR